MARRNPDYSDEESARQKAGAQILERYKDTIKTGMAESLWVMAYADWADENRDEADEQLGRAKGGQDWFDVVLAQDLPKAAEKAATDLYKLYEQANGNLVELYGLAQEADMGEPFSFYETEGDSKDRRLEQQWKLDDAGEFGRMLVMMALGTGVSWFDDHKEFAYERVNFECSYDGDDLTWSGGTSDVREATHRIGSIVVVNDPEGYSHRYLLWFDARESRTTPLLIGASGIDSAIEEMIEWVAEHHPDYLVDEQVQDEFRRLVNDENMGEEQAQQQAEADTTSGDHGHYINDEDWGIIAEDPTEEQIQSVARYGRFGQPIPNPSRAELRDVGFVQSTLREGIDSEFKQKVASIELKPGPTGKVPTEDQFKRDLAANLTMGVMLDDEGEDCGCEHKNPVGRFTAKGERMYQDVKLEYERKGDPRAAEIAARTVYAKAKEGVDGLLNVGSGRPPGVPNPGRFRRIR